MIAPRGQSWNRFSLDGLRIISYCPLCNAHFSPFDANVVEEEGDSHLIHIICRRCSSSILMLVLTGELGVSTVGLVTDLSADEIFRLKDDESVRVDDVLAVHEYLRQPVLT